MAALKDKRRAGRGTATASKEATVVETPSVEELQAKADEALRLSEAIKNVVNKRDTGKRLIESGERRQAIEILRAGIVDGESLNLKKVEESQPCSHGHDHGGGNCNHDHNQAGHGHSHGTVKEQKREKERQKERERKRLRERGRAGIKDLPDSLKKVLVDCQLLLGTYI